MTRDEKLAAFIWERMTRADELKDCSLSHCGAFVDLLVNWSEEVKAILATDDGTTS